MKRRIVRIVIADARRAHRTASTPSGTAKGDGVPLVAVERPVPRISAQVVRLADLPK